ncbi:sensor histidine kinase [Algoriphagus sp. NG3]|uniref:sensor histidine kinase n=1 Tax=Algoriphagus sp. NG3 TaxID=3097546 RepID=UPI002A81E3E9|nr:sensor histidine kinase [Algoriphagus sp. NG3]WPR76555.1 sensor histidine kinase [Algoriphagus sp. NG3]
MGLIKTMKDSGKDKWGDYMLKPTMLLTATRTWLQKDGKKVVLIMMIYTPIYLLLMLLTYRQGYENLVSIYGTPDLWLILGIHSIFEVTLIYYLVIFHFALPLLKSKNFKRFVFQTCIFFTLLFAYEYLLNFHVGSPAVKYGMTFEDFLVWHVLVNIAILFIGFSVAIIIEWNAKGKKEKELEKQKNEAELSAIKHQINPHFLFNSLSFIYSKAISNNDEVAPAVLLLSDIMRYALNRNEDKYGKVDVMQEIIHTKNVIKINQMRFNNQLNIRYLEKINNPNARIPPLVLITLVENGFKHGELDDPNHPLTIQIEIDSIKLHWYMCNKKKRGSKEISNGIGLDNVRKRLELVYGIRHQFQIKEDENFYITDLTIDL